MTDDRITRQLDPSINATMTKINALLTLWMEGNITQEEQALMDELILSLPDENAEYE